MQVTVIGAGLAGSECAWQLAQRGIDVTLREMKPEKKSPAHHSDTFAELVCSNSLRSNDVTSGVGLLKEELRRMGSLIMEAADATQVAAGGALAVDRKLFSEYITNKVINHPNITVHYEEVTEIPTDAVTVIATGPLTSDAMAEKISTLVGGKKLSFFDAAAPIVDFSTIDMEKAFFASRYDRGTPDYINCPMTREEYLAFYEALISAEEARLHDFEKGEKLKVFEGCMPVEVMARRGEDTLRFGPMKPVGIHRPGTEESYYAVVQLRRENESGTMYNLVGFQTHLTFPEQRRVFRMIPGLENADFLRYGVMHRNTFLNSPGLLSYDFSMIKKPNIYFAGQISGVEGYMESAASGILAGYNAARRLFGEEPIKLPKITMLGALSQYISDESVKNFQPMGAAIGLVEPLGETIKDKKERYEKIAQRSLDYYKSIDF